MLRVGALVPLSPPGWVEAGRHLLAGLELGVRDASREGRAIELAVRDTAADPARAVAAVDELAGLGVAALVGEYHSVVARAVAARAEALGMPFLCSSAVLDALTEGPAEHVARLAPAQSRGWSLNADFLLDAGHRRVAVAAQESVYWAAGTRILRERLAARGGDLIALDTVDAQAVGEEILRHGATALLLLIGTPETAASIVEAVRDDARLSGVLIGAPAGQPEFAGWLARLGSGGAGIPFLRYLPERPTALGERVGRDLRAELGEAPSFVAFEGYDTVLALAGGLSRGWGSVDVAGTRGRIRFARVPGVGVWQWAWPPIQVAERDPVDPSRFRVLYGG
ncbi:ABC transporter substrate-binding protein [Actinorhabdospora filicis]|uniref:ABC transporter substrate-binding protein n=1 Tax=Actinorhabdospora filicis TaxID=1785913 RepID=UPI0025550658|nr:ABC transporter substrate-binding protein [Actinorhabdospora filicis]